MSSHVRLPDGPRSRVVLVGTSRYDDARLPDLRAVRQNIEDLVAVLTSAHGVGVPARNCVAIVDAEDPGAIWPVLQDGADRAEDLLLVYYAGHGVLDARGRLYLSLPGTTRNSYRWTALDIDHLRELMAESGADNRVLILDCCFSGRAYEAMGDADPAALATGQVAIKGTYTLTSTSANTPAHAPVGERYTAFTGALLELLEKGIPDGPHLLALDDVYRDLHRTLRSRGAPAPERKGTNNAGDLALLRNPARTDDESDAAQRPQAADTPTPAAPTPATATADPPTVVNGSSRRISARRALIVSVALVIVVVVGVVVAVLHRDTGSGDSAAPVDIVHTSGDVADLHGVEGIDLDTGRRADQNDPGIDISFAATSTHLNAMSTRVTFTVLPETGAEQRQRCVTAGEWIRQIPGIYDLTEGRNICVKTDEGRYSMLTVTRRASPATGTVSFRYTTWQ